MGVKRIVDTDFWIDDKVLDFTVEDRYFMLYLLTNPQSRQLGAYKLPKKVMSFQTGYTVECIVNLLDRFQKIYKMLIYNNDTQEIAIKNYLKYSIVSGGKPVLDCIKKDISLITDKNLVGYVKESLESIIAINDKPVYLDILDIIKDYKYNENQKYNEIYNESIVPRFVNESLKPPKKPVSTKSIFRIPTVEEVKSYCTERNNFVNAESFIDYYSVRGWIPSGSKTQMKDWKAAIRTWEKNDYSQDKKPQTAWQQKQQLHPEYPQYTIDQWEKLPAIERMLIKNRNAQKEGIM